MIKTETASTELPPDVLVIAGLAAFSIGEIEQAGLTLLKRAESAEPGVLHKYLQSKGIDVGEFPDLSGMFEGKL